MNAKQRELIEMIEDLMTFLSRDRLTVAEIIEKIGSEERDPGIPMPIELCPASSVLESADLARCPKSGQPYVLTINPVPEARPTVSELGQVLGAWESPLARREAPPSVIFQQAAVINRDWKVVVIVRIEDGKEDHAASRAVSIAFRRDGDAE